VAVSGGDGPGGSVGNRAGAGKTLEQGEAGIEEADKKKQSRPDRLRASALEEAAGEALQDGRGELDGPPVGKTAPEGAPGPAKPEGAERPVLAQQIAAVPTEPEAKRRSRDTGDEKNATVDHGNVAKTKTGTMENRPLDSSQRKLAAAGGPRGRRRADRSLALRYYYEGRYLLESAGTRAEFSQALAKLVNAASLAPEMQGLQELVNQARRGMAEATE
jgi:hypothetical protein